MSKELFMAKRLRQMAPYMEAHSMDKYRRFAPKEVAPPTGAALTPEEREALDQESTNEERRGMRSRGTM